MEALILRRSPGLPVHQILATVASNSGFQIDMGTTDLPTHQTLAMKTKVYWEPELGTIPSAWYGVQIALLPPPPQTLDPILIWLQLLSHLPILSSSPTFFQHGLHFISHNSDKISFISR